MSHGTSPLAADLLDGAEEISEYIFGASDATHVRRIYHMASKGQIPVTRKGRRILGRKSTLDASFTPETG